MSNFSSNNMPNVYEIAGLDIENMTETKYLAFLLGEIEIFCETHTDDEVLLRIIHQTANRLYNRLDDLDYFNRSQYEYNLPI